MKPAAADCQGLGLPSGREEAHARARQGLDVEQMIALRRIEVLHVAVEFLDQGADFRRPRIGPFDDGSGAHWKA